MMDKMEKNTERSLLTALNNDRYNLTERPKKRSNKIDESMRDESFGNKEPSQVHPKEMGKVNHIPKF